MSDALHWDIDGRDWPHRGASRFVSAVGLRWHVQQMGDEGPVLLLIHGTGAATHSWRDLMPILAHRFRCVAVDLPGHGFTSRAPSWQLSLPGMASSLWALLAAMRIKPDVAVGHSAGAAIAAQMSLREGAASFPIVSLNGAFVPFDGLPGLVFPPMAKLMAATPLLARLLSWHVADRDAVAQLIRNTGSVIDARGVDLYHRLVRNPVHVRSAMGMMAQWELNTLFRRLPRLRSGLHLVAGANDLAVPPDHAQLVQSKIDGARLTLIEGAGHLAHEERPDEIARLILDSAPPAQVHHRQASGRSEMPRGRPA